MAKGLRLSGALDYGYTVTHPHDPYEGVVEVRINKFVDGERPWQAQVLVQGAIVEGDYFPSELLATAWAMREVILIACVSKHGGHDD